MFESRLHYKILVSVGLITTLGLATLASYISFVHQRELVEQNSRALTNVLDSSDLAIRTLMHSGYADIGNVLSESLDNISDIMDIKVAKLDGTSAFENNVTINNVNEKLGYERFETRKEEKVTQALNLTNNELIKILQRASIYEVIEEDKTGERFQTLIYPIKGGDRCLRCHQSNARFRGFIKLKTSLNDMDKSIIKSRWMTAGILVLTVILILFIVHSYVKKVILPPVLKLSSVISNITGQNLTETIDLVSHVEFSKIANIFNLMVQKLSTAYSDLTIEKDKLSTLILDAREGIVVTDQFNKVILVNNAACVLLDKSKEKITSQGLLGLFDEVTCPVDTIYEGQVGDIEPRNIPYRQKTFQAQVAQVLTQSGESAGSAAIFKDITEETKLKEELNRLARTDGLTGLFNRRHFDETAKAELARAARYSHPISLLMFDIDHFKHVNDKWGHDVGDVVIKAVANVAKELTREFDLMCRYGGEEFVVLMPNTDLNTSYKFAEKLRLAAEAWQQDDLPDLKITISIGVSGTPPNPPSTSDELIKYADKQLYKAKNNGRNQVQCQWKLEDMA